MLVRFLRDTGGQFAVIFAVASVALMFAVATALDFTAALKTQTHVQDSLDAATLHAATLAADPSQSDAQITAATEAFFHSNLGEGELANAAIYVEIDRGLKHVSTRLRYEDELIFGGILVPGIRTGQVSAGALFGSEPDNGLCVLALEENSANTIIVDGSADVDAPECDFMANSPTIAQAILFKGSGKTVGKSFCAVGDHTLQGSRTLTPAARDFCTPVLDPFADWTPPREGKCDFRKNEFRIKSTTEVRLQPGHYCTAVDIQAPRIVLEPGNYFFSDAFILNASDQVYGTGVYLQFTASSNQLKITGGSSVKLTKTNDSKLRDIVIYIDPGSRIDPGLELTGNSDISFVGSIYAPNHQVSMTGRTSAYGSGVQTAIVARKIYLSGNTYFSIKPLIEPGATSKPTMVRLIK